jgi:hypothetical protein
MNIFFRTMVADSLWRREPDLGWRDRIGRDGAGTRAGAGKW